MGAVPPRPFSVPLPPYPRVQGLGLSGHQGEPSSQRQSRGGGGWAAQRVFCFSQADSPARGGWGRCQDPQLQPPPWEAPSQLQSLNTQRQWKQEGREEGVPSQTKAPNPTPGLSSFLQVLFFDPLKPSKEVQRSLTLGGEEPTTLPPESLDQPSTRSPNKSVTPMPPEAVSLSTCKSLETLDETQAIDTSLFLTAFLWTPLATFSYLF